MFIFTNDDFDTLSTPHYQYKREDIVIAIVIVLFQVPVKVPNGCSFREENGEETKKMQSVPIIVICFYCPHCELLTIKYLKFFTFLAVCISSISALHILYKKF